jgi:hypothetical protein
VAAGRYTHAEVAEVTVPDGDGGMRTVRYLRRRGLLDPDVVPPVAHHRVDATDRLDLVAARYLGDPLSAWQVADVNRALDPDELTGAGTEGDVLVIGYPQVPP